MNVYLFRHGQKSSHASLASHTSLASNEPDLTDYGHSQAHALAEKIRTGAFMKGSHFLASPRLRAQSTLRPAALFCQQKIQIDDRLDQRESYESAEAFRLRIAELLQFVTNEFASTDTVYLCTHHDWIEESLSVIPADTDLLDSKYWSWHPAQYAHFEVSDGLWKLKAFSQVTG